MISRRSIRAVVGDLVVPQHIVVGDDEPPAPLEGFLDACNELILHILHRRNVYRVVERTEEDEVRVSGGSLVSLRRDLMGVTLVRPCLTRTDSRS